jgi:hypothetical protein
MAKAQATGLFTMSLSAETTQNMRFFILYLIFRNVSFFILF